MESWKRWDHLTHQEADEKHLMECRFQANCPPEQKQMGLCECMVSKTVYFALSFHEEHKKSQHRYKLHKIMGVHTH